MVFDLGTNVPKTHLTAFLTAKLTSEQLDAIQTSFGRGAATQSFELFIKDNPKYHDLTHADIRKAEPGEEPILVIDEDTPSDGGIWYMSQFATEDEVEDGEAESTNVLWKIRIRIADLPMMHANYDIGNQSIREDLDSVGVDYPAPEDYTVDDVYPTDPEDEEEKWLPPTWVILEPGEYEETTNEQVLSKFVPRQEKMYRMELNIAKTHGFKLQWMPMGDAKPVKLLDGSMKTFPEGSINIQADYDLGLEQWGAYRRPEGSL